MTSESPLRAPPDKRDVEALLEFGVINLDKPPGPSAHQVSSWIKSLTDLDRAAHAGTLDPKVTGVLPVLLGNATRLVPALLEGSKEYVAVLELHASPPTDLESTVAEFEAEIYQKPPRKSAVARRLRTRTVHELDVLEVADRQALLRMEVESGTYVRKLCHDIGLALGTGAHMGDLRRTATTPFDDSELHTLHDLSDGLARYEESGREDWLREVVHPAERALTHLPEVVIAPSAAKEVANGAPVYGPGVIAGPETEPDGLVVCTTPDGAAVCLGTLVGDGDQAAGTVVDLEAVLV
ncbi:RNA-guided pseudouridylation complex pseudouridine synthase subunit Cbf5 [Halodesulfurarchaeum sp.]|uniref:RNA-guided pseudouridylation complex pseudouridine synthase subunit Cbf5 n=1 Tax=Halodesulfurarchaeum sp. TaxID=1980530 RepID=UPI002FC3D594